MDKLKLYVVVMGIGAVLGVTVAEIWRRRMRDDSYLNYLPPPRDREGAATAPVDGCVERPTGCGRQSRHLPGATGRAYDASGLARPDPASVHQPHPRSSRMLPCRRPLRRSTRRRCVADR